LSLYTFVAGFDMHMRACRHFRKKLYLLESVLTAVVGAHGVFRATVGSVGVVAFVLAICSRLNVAVGVAIGLRGVAADDKQAVGMLKDLLHVEAVALHACTCLLWRPPVIQDVGKGEVLTSIK